MKQARSDPNSLLRRNDWPRPKPKPDIEANCSTCLKNMMFWPEGTKFIGWKFVPQIRCSECYQVRSADAPRT